MRKAVNLVLLSSLLRAQVLEALHKKGTCNVHTILDKAITSQCSNEGKNCLTGFMWGLNTAQTSTAAERLGTLVAHLASSDLSKLDQINEQLELLASTHLIETTCKNVQTAELNQYMHKLSKILTRD